MTIKVHRAENSFRENIGKSWHRAGSFLLSILFPRRCPFCHEIVPTADDLICPDCRRLVKRYYLIQEPVCKRCGKAISSMRSEYCMDCAEHPRSFDGGISVFRYGRRNLKPIPGKLPGYEKHSMGESVLRFKYHNCREYADYYIEEMLSEYGAVLCRFRPDVIIPVPVHPSRYRKRGYNQAEILARKLGERLQIEVCSTLLVRVKKTRPQKELNTTERMRNLQKAFTIEGTMPKGYRRILLIDDIYTTGSTMEICTRRLKEAGAEKVFCISICSGQVPDASEWKL